MSRPSDALRLSALTTLAVGSITLGVAGVVPVVGVVTTIVLATGSAFIGSRLTTPAEVAFRRRVAAAVLAIAAVTTLLATRGDLTTSAGLALGLLLCTAAVTHSLVLDTVRDVRVNTAIAVSMLVLAAGVAPGLRIAVPVVLTWACVVTTLVLSARDAEGTEATARAVTTGSAPSPAAPIAAAVAATALVGLAIALVLPHPSGLTASTGFGQAAGGSGSNAPGSSTRGAEAYLGGGALSLDGRGRLPDTPVAVVTGTGDRLWRSTSLDVYDGRSWSATETVPRQLSAPGSTEALVPPDPRSPAQSDPTTRADGVGWLLGDSPAVVLAPGLLTEVRLRERGDVALARDRRVLATSTTANPSFVVEATVLPDADDGATSGAGTGPDATNPDWLAVPASLPARVGVLAGEVTAGTTGRVEAVRALEDYLRAGYTYDLDSPVAPPGTDTVDQFLFVSKSGFCEHFASAEVVMLRTLGIPSRLVSGFSGGKPDSSGRGVLLSSDAHAWVEVWVPGTGWVSSDPTAGSTLAGPHKNAVEQTLRTIREATTGTTVRKLVLAFVLVGLAALALYLPTRRRRVRTGSSAARTAAPLFAAFHRLEAALAAAGRPRGEAESVRALAARLGATDDVVGALLAVERASYAPVPPTRADAQAAADVIDRATAQLLSSTAAGQRP